MWELPVRDAMSDEAERVSKLDGMACFATESDFIRMLFACPDLISTVECWKLAVKFICIKKGSFKIPVKFELWTVEAFRPNGVFLFKY